jgi:hypothetical protein
MATAGAGCETSFRRNWGGLENCEKSSATADNQLLPGL